MKISHIALVIVTGLLFGCGAESDSKSTLTQPPKPITFYDGDYVVDVDVSKETGVCVAELEFGFRIKNGDLVSMPGDFLVAGLLQVQSGEVTGSVVADAANYSFAGKFDSNKKLFGDWIDSNGCKGTFKQQ